MKYYIHFRVLEDSVEDKAYMVELMKNELKIHRDRLYKFIYSKVVEFQIGISEYDFARGLRTCIMSFNYYKSSRIIKTLNKNQNRKQKAYAKFRNCRRYCKSS